MPNSIPEVLKYTTFRIEKYRKLLYEAFLFTTVNSSTKPCIICSLPRFLNEICNVKCDDVMYKVYCAVKNHTKFKRNQDYDR